MSSDQRSLFLLKDPNSIEEHTSKLLKQFQDSIKDIQESAKQSWQEVSSFSNVEGIVTNWLWTCELMAKVQPIDEIRKSYSLQIPAIKNAISETWMKPKLFSVFKKVHEDEKSLGEEERKLLNDYLKLFTRNGASLDGDARKRFEELNKKLGELCVQFLQRVNEDKTEVHLSQEELDGLPLDFLNNLKKVKNEKGEELCVVTMKYPDILPCLRRAKNDETRKKLEIAFDNRAEENLPTLLEVLQIRKEIASILGYKSHAAYVSELKMAENPDNISKFLEKLVKGLKPLAEREMNILKQIKSEEKKVNKESVDVKSYDISYYVNIWKERDFGIDDEVVRTYFPMSILTVYEEVLHLKFVEQSIETWHPDVRAFDVYDVSSGTQSTEPIGRFYLDLFPRNGKYSHASSYPVIDSFIVNGKRQFAITTVIANFTKPTPSKPSLLTHREVITYFHEFGHTIHSICAQKPRFSRQTWFNTEMDFVEAPSQMLENWCWDASILKRLTCHYETNAPMPDDLIKSIIKAKHVSMGIQKLRQTFMSIYDMHIHSEACKLGSDPKELLTIWDNMRKEITNIETTPGTAYVASWMHLCAGYDAGYYGYLWSEVFSSDMFSRFKNEGVLSRKVGLEYRKKILEPGATKPGMEMLRDFLGRNPNEESFMKELGIETS